MLNLIHQQNLSMSQKNLNREHIEKENCFHYTVCEENNYFIFSQRKDEEDE